LRTSRSRAFDFEVPKPQTEEFAKKGRKVRKEKRTRKKEIQIQTEFLTLSV